LTRVARERKLRDLMNSHAHNFAADGTTVRPTMRITSTRAAGVTWSRGCVSLKGEFVT
jgi:hypothetical protein